VTKQPVATIRLIGVAAQSCGKYVENMTGERADEYKQMYQQWIWGFMTDHNTANPHQQSATADDATVIAFLNNHCQRNPLSSVSAGTWALVAETGGKPVPFRYQN
jgi:hypothetical protein